MKFVVPIKFVSKGDIQIEADTYEEATDKAEEKLKELYGLGNPTTSKEISWSGAEAEVDGWEIDLDE